MLHLSHPRQNQLVDLAIGGIFLIIALHPNGWLSAICLIPLVVAVTFLEDWHVAGASILALAASEIFSSVPWLTPPTMVLFIIAVLCLVQMQQLRRDRRTPAVNVRTRVTESDVPELTVGQKKNRSRMLYCRQPRQWRSTRVQLKLLGKFQ
jgi:hypothetical protein